MLFRVGIVCPSLGLFGRGGDHFQDYAHWHLIAGQSFWRSSNDEHPLTLPCDLEDQKHLPYSFDLLAHGEWLDHFGG